MASLNRTIGGRMDNIRQMMLAAGIGEYNAILSLPYMYFLPRTCDPYAQGTMQIVEGLQNLLNARGKRVLVSGYMDPGTMAAVQTFSGDTWVDKTWLQIYGDVMRGRVAPGLTPPLVPSSTAMVDAEADAQIPTAGLTDAIGGVATNPYVWLAAGASLFYFFGWKRPNPRSRR